MVSSRFRFVDWARESECEGLRTPFVEVAIFRCRLQSAGARIIQPSHEFSKSRFAPTRDSSVTFSWLCKPPVGRILANARKKTHVE